MPALALAVASLLAVTDPSGDELRRMARDWEARDRSDLARQALEKLASLRTARADDLLLLAELDLQHSDLPAARRILDRLLREFSSSSEARTLETEVRIVTRDRLGLASIHRLIEVGRGVEVRAALAKVFPDGAPNGIFGIEYYELLAGAPDGRADAQAGLLQLMRAHPKDPRYTIALARLLARRAQTARVAVSLLEPLRGRPDVRASDYHDALDLAQASLAAAPADTVEETLPPAIDSPRASSPVVAQAEWPAPALPAPAAIATTHEVTVAAIESTPEVAVPAQASAAAQAVEDEDAATWIWDQYREGKRLAVGGDRLGGEALMSNVLERYPNHPDALLAAALWAEFLHDPATARRLVTRIASADRSAGALALLERLSLTPVVASPSPVTIEPVSWSVQWVNKPGEEGLSALKSVTVPVEWRHVLPNQSMLGLMVEAVSLDAGAIPTQQSAGSGLGTVAISGLGRFAGTSTHTQGIAVGVAWHHRDWVLDVGSTPIGFAMQRLVGGIRYAPTVGDMDLSVEAFRRPVTASLLSYAGRIDPATGRWWGALTDSGAALRVGRYRADSSVSFALRATQIEGTGVKTNDMMSARLAADRVVGHPIHGDLSLGAALGFQAYTRNLLGYTWGNGGYFSPQSYSTLALPLEWSRRQENSALRVRFAPTFTHRHDSGSPWYPTDASATATAIANGLTPVVTGGTVSGFSVVFALTYERQLAHGVFGMSVGHDRSDYYHPVSVSFYFRPGALATTTYEPVRPYMNY